MDLNQAIAAHSDWKLKLRNAISKQETVDASSLSTDNKCPLGQWLHGEGKTKFWKLKSYPHCVSKHAEFHREAGKVATAINARKYDEAAAMMTAGTPFTSASMAAASAILALKNESGQ